MQNLEHIVMRRVRTIALIRRATAPLMLKLYMGGLFCAFLLSVVSLEHVYANAPALQEVDALVSFLMSALASTETAVQLTCLSLALLAGMVLRDVGQVVVTTLRPLSP